MGRTRSAVIVVTSAFALALVALSPAPAGAAEVTNGGFETGDFSGWTTDQLDEGGGVWDTYTAVDPPFDEPDWFEFAPEPPCDTYAAALTQFDPSSDILYQDLALEADATHELSFTHWYLNDFFDEPRGTSQSAGPAQEDNFITPDTLDLDVPNQQYRVDIVDPGANPFSVADDDVLVEVFRTDPGDPDTIEPTEVTVDLSAYAGQTVRLRFAVAVTENPIHLVVDCVQVASSTQETTTTTAAPTTTATAAPAQAVAATPAFTG